MKQNYSLSFLGCTALLLSPFLLTACSATDGLLGQSAADRDRAVYSASHNQIKSVNTAGNANKGMGNNAATAADSNAVQNQAVESNTPSDVTAVAPAATTIAPTAAPTMVAPTVE
ncbi:MAG: hypothetical protein WC785_10470 [Tatlockia sp.]